MFTTPPRTRGPRPRRLGAIALAVVLGGSIALAACGSDDDGDSASEDTEAAAFDDEASAAFCDSVIGVDTVISAGGPEGPDPAAVSSALDELEATAPPDMSDDISALAADAKESLPDGELSPESEQTRQDAYAYLEDNCDAQVLAVTAEDYAYTNLPESAESGPTVVELDNQGTEFHEMVMVRINDDVDASIEDLAALPEEEALSQVEMVGTVFGPPGDTTSGAVDLEPGRYGVLCFLPQGATPEGMQAMESSDTPPAGQPHFMLGMSGEFTVA